MTELAALPCRSTRRKSMPRLLCLLALPFALEPASRAAIQTDGVIQVAPAQNTTVASLAEYQRRLLNLDRIVVACQRAMTVANCQSSQVGPDIRLALPSGSRLVRFAWLRGLLGSATTAAAAAKDGAASHSASLAKIPEAKADTGKPQPDSGDESSSDDSAPNQPQDGKLSPAPARPSYILAPLAQQLEDAHKRLAADYAAATAAASGTTQPSTTSQPAPDFVKQRQALTRILAAKEYQSAPSSESLLDRVFEKIGNWIDRAVEKLQEAGFHSKWIGLTAEISFVVALCIGLVWFLIRLERQGRLGLALIRPGFGSGAASERDWQLWLADARAAAAKGAWRDAIHLLYWASISRLESSGLWPADRARTPREYLALLSGESLQRTDLLTLTRSFERTWYAGRPAAEADFREAEQLAGKLGAQ